MNLQSCYVQLFWRQCIYEKENTLFELDLQVKVTQNVAQYPPHRVNYAPAKFKVATSNDLGGENMLFHCDLGVNVTLNIA